MLVLQTQFQGKITVENITLVLQAQFDGQGYITVGDITPVLQTDRFGRDHSKEYHTGATQFDCQITAVKCQHKV